MERDDVGSGQHGVQLQQGRQVRPRLNIGVVSYDPCPESLQGGSDSTCDPPIPDETHGQGGESGDRSEVVDAPCPRPGRIVGDHHLAKRGEDQGQGVCGDFLNRIVGDVRHHDPGACRGLQVDVVESNPVAGDDLALLEACDGIGRPGQVGVEDGVGICRGAQDRFDIAGGNGELGIDLGKELSLHFDRGEHLVADHHLVLAHPASRNCRVALDESGRVLDLWGVGQTREPREGRARDQLVQLFGQGSRRGLVLFTDEDHRRARHVMRTRRTGPDPVSE